MAKKSSCGSCQGSCHGEEKNEAVEMLEFLSGMAMAVATGVPGYKQMARSIIRDFEKGNGPLGPTFKEFWELLEEFGAKDLEVNIKDLEDMGIDTQKIIKTLEVPAPRRSAKPAKSAKTTKARRRKA